VALMAKNDGVSVTGEGNAKGELSNVHQSPCRRPRPPSVQVQSLCRQAPRRMPRRHQLWVKPDPQDERHASDDQGRNYFGNGGCYITI
jgi:hypothetical protein